MPPWRDRPPMTPTDPPPTDRESPIALDFAGRWAEFTRAFSFYPATNHRVQDAQDALLTALPEAIRHVGVAAADGLEVRFERTQFWVGEEAHDIKRGSLLDWLSERIEKAALAAVVFQPGLQAPALQAFTARLIEHYKRRDLDLSFEELWPEKYEGLDLVDRRFDGFFDDAVAQRRARGPSRGARGRGGGGKGGGHLGPDAAGHRAVAHLVAEDPRVADCVRRLSMEVRALDEEGKDKRKVDVISRIIDLLPHDALDRYEDAVLVVARILEDLEARVSRADGQGALRAFSDEAVLNQLVLATSHGVLGSHAPAAAEVAERLQLERSLHGVPGSAPVVERPGDEKIVDDLALLWDDMADLPPPSTSEFTEARTESVEEELGVYLHFLQKPDGTAPRDKLTQALVDLLQRAEAHELGPLRLALEQGRHGSEPAFLRLVTLLRTHGLVACARTSGFLAPEWVARSFPNHFGLYLDTLNPGFAADRAELEAICSEIGAVRFRELAGTLVHREGILEEPRVRRILASPDLTMLPLVRIVLRDGEERLRADAVHVLRRMRLQCPEACLLYVWDDPAKLPLDYLLTIADPECSQTDLENLHPQIATEICQYLRASEGHEDRVDRRLYAMQHLGTFFHAEAERLLVDMVRTRRLGLFPREPKSVRTLAQSVLASHRRRRKEVASHV